MPGYTTGTGASPHNNKHRGELVQPRLFLFQSQSHTHLFSIWHGAGTEIQFVCIKELMTWDDSSVF